MRYAAGVAGSLVALHRDVRLLERRARARSRATFGPTPTLAAPSPSRDSRQCMSRRRSVGPTADADAGRRASPCTRSRRASIIRAGSTCCRTATCWSPRRTRRRAPEDAKGIKGWVAKLVMKRAGAEVAERQPHHAAARRRRRRRRRDADRRSSTDLHSPFGMALVGAISTSRTPTRMLRFPYTTGATQIDEPGDAGRRPARRARSTTTGPRTSSRAPTARSSM